ncbi:MAG: histidine phosphatase family protein [Flavobacteriales bacterium]
MKTLFLVRHAKSVQNLEGIPDCDRPLKSSGIADAHRVSKSLAQGFTSPAYWVSSCANRAHHTALIFAQNFQKDFSEVVINDALYTFEPSGLIDLLGRIDPNVDSSIAFGHNPAIAVTASRLGNVHFDHFPTSGVAVIEIGAENWRAIPDSGKTVYHLFPKQLRHR